MMVNNEPSVREMAALWKACAAFIEKHEISCAESVYQSDNILIHSSELVEDVCEIVGYVEFNEE